ncbi:DUF2680 domain-containing protein [Gracilibacillus oryzae]|nr:DUF2680 domain-containing protein [Gracilibacillus oryzae]
MKKWIMTISAVLFMTFAFASEFSAETNQNVKLTDEQKQEMAKLQNDMMNQKVAIINKYVEYGVLPEEKAKKMIDHLEAKLDKLEENGFIPKWDRKPHHHKQ